MERLTEREAFGGGVPIGYFEDDCCDCQEYCQKQASCSKCNISACFEKLADYEDAEEDGRIFRTDFKPGDNAYMVEKSKSIFDGSDCWIVEEINILDVSAGGFITDDVERYIWYDTSDGMIFKTKEEAEAEVKRRQEDPEEMEDDEDEEE